MENENKFRNSIQNIEKLNGNKNTKYKVFSIFDHWLNSKEIKKNKIITNYSQAVKDNQLSDFMKYQMIYEESFSIIFDYFNSEILFYTSIWCVNEYTNTLKWDYIYDPRTEEERDLDEQDQGIDDKQDIYGKCLLYKPKSKTEFLDYIVANSKEINPMSDLYFIKNNIYISFGWDLTFRVYFVENSMMEEVEKIFVKKGFSMLKEGYSKDD